MHTQYYNTLEVTQRNINKNEDFQLFSLDSSNIFDSYGPQKDYGMRQDKSKQTTAALTIKINDNERNTALVLSPQIIN